MWQFRVCLGKATAAAAWTSLLVVPVYEMFLSYQCMKCFCLTSVWNVSVLPVCEMFLSYQCMKCFCLTSVWNVSVLPVYEMFLSYQCMKCFCLTSVWNVSVLPVYEMFLSYQCMKCFCLTRVWNVSVFIWVKLQQTQEQRHSHNNYLLSILHHCATLILSCVYRIAVELRQAFLSVRSFNVAGLKFTAV